MIPALCLTLFALGPICSHQDTVIPAAQTAVAADYKLDIDDTISVEVQRHGDVNRTVRIPLDGLLRLPRVLTPIPVRGLTCQEVADRVHAALIKEGKLKLQNGQVQCFIVTTRVRRVFIRGNATTGRDLDLKSGWRVTELIALIGGIPQPDRVTAKLINPARTAPVTIDLAGILKDPNHPSNVLLLEGDSFILDQPQRKRILVKGEGPRGIHEIDERFGLRYFLTQLGFSVRDASGDLRHSKLKRKTVAGEVNSAETTTTVDLYTLLTDDNAPDVPLQDLDTLEIPLSMDFVYVWGELGGPRKYPLPQDRKTYLQDVMATASITTSTAKIGGIRVARANAGRYSLLGEYDWGKYLKDFDQKRNPEIKAQDIVFVPAVRHQDPGTLLNQVVGGVQGIFFLKSVFGL